MRATLRWYRTSLASGPQLVPTTQASAWLAAFAATTIMVAALPSKLASSTSRTVCPAATASTQPVNWVSGMPWKELYGVLVRSCALRNGAGELWPDFAVALGWLASCPPVAALGEVVNPIALAT